MNGNDNKAYHDHGLTTDEAILARQAGMTPEASGLKKLFDTQNEAIK